MNIGVINSSNILLCVKKAVPEINAENYAYVNATKSEQNTG